VRGQGASVTPAGILIRLQEMIWRCSASSLQLKGQPKICADLKAAFSAGGARPQDVSYRVTMDDIGARWGHHPL
jgi:hypothetical protein